MNTTSLFKNNRLCKALTGVSVEELKNLLPSFEEALKRERKLRKPERKRAVGAGQKGTLHKAEQKLVFILIYLKTYPTFDVLGFLTGRERSRACRWAHRPLPVVEHAIGGTKRPRSVSDIYRNKKANGDDMFMLLATGIGNFHLQQTA